VGALGAREPMRLIFLDCDIGSLYPSSLVFAVTGSVYNGVSKCLKPDKHPKPNTGGPQNRFSCTPNQPSYEFQ